MEEFASDEPDCRPIGVLMVARLKPRAKAMTSAPARVRRLELFGRPPLLEGEDEDIYNELRDRMYAAVDPADIIEEMFVEDMLYLQWDIVRLRRLKLSLLTESGSEALKSFLSANMNLELYEDIFRENLTQILEKKLPKDQAQELAEQGCRSNEADPKIKQLLSGSGHDLDDIQDAATRERAQELAQAYARREPEAIDQVNEILASAGRTMDNIYASQLTEEIDKIERIERLITVAETRRNVSLRELDRHRAVLAEALRQKIPEIESTEYRVIEPTRTEGRARRDQ